MSEVLLTGATGFVGAAVLPVLARGGHTVRCAARSARAPSMIAVGPLGRETAWARALSGVETVVHLAGVAHVTGKRVHETALDEVNVHGTRRLAEEALRHGIRRFVFLSSVKVNGEATDERPFTESDPPAPQDAYARSKARAECALAEIARHGSMEIVILRAPLVYGPGAKANFLALLRLAATGLPLPFARIANRRSMLFVGNLADMLVAVLARTEKPGIRTYLVSDGEDLSIGEIIGCLRAGMGMRPRLFGMPVLLLRTLGTLSGRSDTMGKLLSSLQVDSTAFRTAYGWRAPIAAREALAQTGHWFAQGRKPREAAQ